MVSRFLMMTFMIAEVEFKNRTDSAACEVRGKEYIDDDIYVSLRV